MVDLFETNSLPKLVYEEIVEKEDLEEKPVESCLTYMQAGCSNSHTLEIKTECDDQPKERKQRKDLLITSKEKYYRFNLLSFNHDDMNVTNVNESFGV